MINASSYNQILDKELHLRDVMGTDDPYLTPIIFPIRVHVIYGIIYLMLTHYYLVQEKPEDEPFISRSGVQEEILTWATVMDPFFNFHLECPCLWVVVWTNGRINCFFWMITCK